MIGQFSRIRFCLSLLTCACVLAQAGTALASTEIGRTRLEDHFSSFGKVEYSLYTPLGGPEMGAAVIQDAGGYDLRVAELKNGQVMSRINQRMPDYTGRRPFTFLLTGEQFLSYPTHSWTDAQGRKHDIGDLTIYDLTKDPPEVLFELKNVADLSFQAEGSLTASNLIWQPADTYLNEEGIFPQKYNYFTVHIDDETGAYDIVHHLSLLEDQGLVESARYNNRGVFYYIHNDLDAAIAAFAKANIITDRDQSVILRNTDLVKSELADIEYQASHHPDTVVDDARVYFWTGQYQSALRVLETRQRRMKDSDLAMSALSLAHLKRWPEADNITAELKARGVPWLGDFLADLLSVAELQGLPSVIEVQLRAMEALDPTHPALVAMKARLLVNAGKQADAQRILEAYMFGRRPQREVTEAMHELYGIYYNQDDVTGMERLKREASSGEITNLSAWVSLKDYQDFSVVMNELQVDHTDWIKAPTKALEDITLE